MNLAASKLPLTQLQPTTLLTAAAAKRRIRGQRFSSPIKDAGGGDKGRSRAAAVAEPARKNLFSPSQIPDKENQGGNSTALKMQSISVLFEFYSLS